MTRGNRREFIQHAGAGALSAVAAGSLAPGLFASGSGKRPRLPVAAIATVYEPKSHADVIIGKILEGWDQQGGPGPDLKLTGLYLDQISKTDIGVRLARRHGVPIFKTIEESITGGGNGIPVAGVLSIGEHGDYPSTPDTGQDMYPRRRFFDEIVATFRKYGKVVPLFNDKGLGYRFQDARHMVDTAAKMKIPMTAGSSIPVTWRFPPLELSAGCEIEEALSVGYAGLESYGFHATELLQAMVERRRDGETGVSSVRVVQGQEIWKTARAGEWSRELLDAALATVPQDGSLRKAGRPEDNFDENAAVILVRYGDGMKGTVVMANGHAADFAFAAKLKGDPRPVATQCARQRGWPYAHHGLLLRATEAMIHSGKPSHPVERTLLTTGVIDAAMHSRFEKGRWLKTPELAVQYQPLTWPFARGEIPAPRAYPQRFAT